MGSPITPYCRRRRRSPSRSTRDFMPLPIIPTLSISDLTSNPVPSRPVTPEPLNPVLLQRPRVRLPQSPPPYGGRGTTPVQDTTPPHAPAPAPPSSPRPPPTPITDGRSHVEHIHNSLQSLITAFSTGALTGVDIERLLADSGDVLRHLDLWDYELALEENVLQAALEEMDGNEAGAGAAAAAVAENTTGKGAINEKVAVETVSRPKLEVKGVLKNLNKTEENIKVKVKVKDNSLELVVPSIEVEKDMAENKDPEEQKQKQKEIPKQESIKLPTRTMTIARQPSRNAKAPLINDSVKKLTVLEKARLLERGGLKKDVQHTETNIMKNILENKKLVDPKETLLAKLQRGGTTKEVERTETTLMRSIMKKKKLAEQRKEELPFVKVDETVVQKAKEPSPIPSIKVEAITKEPSPIPEKNKSPNTTSAESPTVKTKVQVSLHRLSIREKARHLERGKSFEPNGSSEEDRNKNIKETSMEAADQTPKNYVGPLPDSSDQTPKDEFRVVKKVGPWKADETPEINAGLIKSTNQPQNDDSLLEKPDPTDASLPKHESPRPLPSPLNTKKPQDKKEAEDVENTPTKRPLPTLPTRPKIPKNQRKAATKKTKTLKIDGRVPAAEEKAEHRVPVGVGQKPKRPRPLPILPEQKKPQDGLLVEIQKVDKLAAPGRQPPLPPPPPPIPGDLQPAIKPPDQERSISLLKPNVYNPALNTPPEERPISLLQPNVYNPAFNTPSLPTEERPISLLKPNVYNPALDLSSPQTPSTRTLTPGPSTLPPIEAVSPLGLNSPVTTSTPATPATPATPVSTNTKRRFRKVKQVPRIKTPELEPLKLPVDQYAGNTPKPETPKTPARATKVNRADSLTPEYLARAAGEQETPKEDEEETPRPRYEDRRSPSPSKFRPSSWFPDTTVPPTSSTPSPTKPTSNQESFGEQRSMTPNPTKSNIITTFSRADFEPTPKAVPILNYIDSSPTPTKLETGIENLDARHLWPRRSIIQRKGSNASLTSESVRPMGPRAMPSSESLKSLLSRRSGSIRSRASNESMRSIQSIHSSISYISGHSGTSSMSMQHSDSVRSAKSDASSLLGVGGYPLQRTSSTESRQSIQSEPLVPTVNSSASYTAPFVRPESPSKTSMLPPETPEASPSPKRNLFQTHIRAKSSITDVRPAGLSFSNPKPRPEMPQALKTSSRTKAKPWQRINPHKAELSHDDVEMPAPELLDKVMQEGEVWRWTPAGVRSINSTRRKKEDGGSGSASTSPTKVPLNRGVVVVRRRKKNSSDLEAKSSPEGQGGDQKKKTGTFV